VRGDTTWEVRPIEGPYTGAVYAGVGSSYVSAGSAPTGTYALGPPVGASALPSLEVTTARDRL